MKKTNYTIDLSIIAPFLLLIIFSSCILLVLLFGTNLYKEAIDRDRNLFEQRTLNQYITTKIHQADEDGMMFIGNFEEVSASDQGDTFFFIEEIGNSLYCTRVYCHEGYLYELFSSTENNLKREDGEKILPLNDISFKHNGNSIIITITHTNGRSDSRLIALRSLERGPYEE